MPQLFYSATSRALGVSANTRACACAQRKSTVRRRVCRPVERVFRSGSFNRSGTSCFGACHQGVVEQRNSSHLGHQPSHRRVSSRQHHAQARRTKYCRPRGESAGQSRWLVASELVFPDDNVPTRTAGGRLPILNLDNGKTYSGYVPLDGEDLTPFRLHAWRSHQQ